MEKETYLYCKRGLRIWQKRPNHVAKESYLYGKRDLLTRWPAPAVEKLVFCFKSSSELAQKSAQLMGLLEDQKTAATRLGVLFSAAFSPHTPLNRTPYTAHTLRTPPLQNCLECPTPYTLHPTPSAALPRAPHPARV